MCILWAWHPPWAGHLYIHLQSLSSIRTTALSTTPEVSNRSTPNDRVPVVMLSLLISIIMHSETFSLWPVESSNG